MNPDMTLAAAVVENPNVRPVFDALGLDYCCGGQQRVGLAVAQAGLSMADVEAAVAEASVRPDECGQTRPSPLWQACRH